MNIAAQMQQVCIGFNLLDLVAPLEEGAAVPIPQVVGF